MKKNTVKNSELKDEWANLLEMWETQWEHLTTDQIIRFLSLERKLKLNNKNK